MFLPCINKVYVCMYGISDHCLVYAFRKVSIPPAFKGIKLVNYRQFKHFESVNFRADILSQPWDILKGRFDPNETWLKWKAPFLKCVMLTLRDNLVPRVSHLTALGGKMRDPGNEVGSVKPIRLRPSKSSWITTGLKKRMNYRDHLKKKAVWSVGIIIGH